jgi:transcription initiation factor TFIIIB Brf1 subunit/transcription initiation factor TFIIB
MDCEHDKKFELIDIHTGDIVCSNCGKVLDINFQQQNKEEVFNYNLNEQKDIENILDQLHLPESYVDFVIDNYKKKFRNKKNMNTIDKISTCIYSTINTYDNCISLRSLSNITKREPKHIKSNIKLHNTDELANKYLIQLNISYKDQSVIKSEIKKYINTGYNPLTTIAGIIYNYCRRNKINHSISHISKIIGISPISIRRFLNNELSHRS